MADRKCPKGWILTPSETDGEYVPFFVNVRDKDIHWDENNLDQTLKNIVESSKSDDIQLQYPMYQWVVNSNGWRVEIRQDGTYRATTRFNIQQYVTFRNTHTLSVKLTLPLYTKDDVAFNVQAMLYGKQSDIQSSSITYAGSNKGTSQLLTTAFNEISFLICSETLTFPSDIKTNTNYSYEQMFLTVEGTISTSHHTS